MNGRDARRDDIVELIHGRRVADPYRWLEDPASVATRDWLAQQNALTDAYFDGCAVRQTMLTELAELSGVAAPALPTYAGGRAFLTRQPPGSDTPRLYVQDRDGRERVLVDPPEGAMLGRWHAAPHGRLLAYQITSGGSELSALHVVDVDTGTAVGRPIDRIWYASVAWLPDSSGFYYVRCAQSSQTALHRRVYLHRLGSDADGDDAPVFGAGLAPVAGLRVAVDQDRWLVVHVTAGTAGTTEVWLADLGEGTPDSPRLTEVHPGLEARTAARVAPDGLLYLHTTHEAPRGRLCRTDPRDPAPANWQEVLPQDPRATLEAVAFADGTRPELVAVYLRHGGHEVSTHDRATGQRLVDLALPGVGSICAMAEGGEGRADLWLAYTDHVTPATLLSYRTGDRTLRGDGSRAAAPERIVSRQVTYHSADGTAVRMFLIAGPGAPDRPRPTLLIGYGGFGASMLASYQPDAVAWAAAGGVVAIACLRGGGEEGEAWHRAGMREHKQNTFDDFHAAARWLIDRGYTTPRQLGILGASNAGLLVGAALTQHPELYGAAVLVAPLLDMVRYERSGLGPAWRTEFGSADDPADFPHLLAYSPYHRVVDGDYPPTLLITGDADRRVDPMHARKMCAALKHASPHGRILLRTADDVGHRGSRTVAAEALAFLARETGLAS